MKVVYIAGPYRANTPWLITRNIERAREAAAIIWEYGMAAICPHSNTALMDGVTTDEQFLAGGLEILTRCDAVFVQGPHDGVTESKGTQEEIKLAMELGIPVFLSYEHLRFWADHQKLYKDEEKVLQSIK